MINETRVNLKHLLEDIRDSYPLPVEEVIVIELISNALDSGANVISLQINPEQKSLTILDNGKGMKRKEIRDYHNIATTTKIRGKGIGFAGVGAKLALLLASEVITETRGGHGSQCATTWHLSSPVRAPWKFIPFSGQVPTSRGTAVTMVFNRDTRLLEAAFLKELILRQFFPLFIREFNKEILRYVYSKGIQFYIDGQNLPIFPDNFFASVRPFRLAFGRKKSLAGFGFLCPKKLHEFSAADNSAGLEISTYGKVIKNGWEWLGIRPKESSEIYGLVEIPAMAEILTINKMDFLRDSASLKKYYQYRKAIQEAILPILAEFGDQTNADDQIKQLKPLTKEIEQTLKNLLGDFPELLPLLGMKRGQESGAFNPDPILDVLEKKPSKELIQIGQNLLEDPIENEAPKAESGAIKAEAKKGKKNPAILIGLEQALEKDPVARMIENKIYINTAHPAYQKALKKGLVEYHTVFCIAWILSYYLEGNRTPQIFLDNFLAAWARGNNKTQNLLNF